MKLQDILTKYDLPKYYDEEDLLRALDSNLSDLRVLMSIESTEVTEKLNQIREFTQDMRGAIVRLIVKAEQQ